VQVARAATASANGEFACRAAIRVRTQRQSG
jgi:hypothetical protein